VEGLVKEQQTPARQGTRVGRSGTRTSSGAAAPKATRVVDPGRLAGGDGWGAGWGGGEKPNHLKRSGWMRGAPPGCLGEESPSSPLGCLLGSARARPLAVSRWAEGANCTVMASTNANKTEGVIVDRQAGGT
jgi:hypothetical protein